MKDRQLFSFYFFLITLSVLSLFQAPAQIQQNIANQISVEFNEDQVLTGQRISFTISAPFNFSIDQMSIPIDGPAEHIQGDSSRSSSFRSINGRSYSSTSFQLGLRALAPGSVTVGPFQVQLSDRVVEVPAISTKIVDLSEVGIERFEVPEYGHISHPQSNSVMLMKKITGDYFSSVDLPRKVYEGQTFPVTTYYYKRNDPTVPNYVFMGLYPTEHDDLLLVDTQNLTYEPTSEIAPHDSNYVRIPIVREVVLPIKTGNIDIKGYSLVFGTKRNPIQTDRAYELLAPSNTVSVLPLPPADGNVNGKLVGDVMVASKISSIDGEVGDIVTIEVLFSGESYLKPFTLTDEENIDGLLHVNTSAEFAMSSRATYPVRTQKQFKIEYQLLKPGELTIPAFRFAIFNPETETYSYKETSEYTLHVTGEEAKSDSLASNKNDSTNRQEVTNRIDDQTPIVQEPTESAPLLSVSEFTADQNRVRISPTAIIVPNILAATGGFIWYLFIVYLRPSRWYRSRLEKRSKLNAIETHLNQTMESAQAADADTFYREVVLTLRQWLLEKTTFDIQSHDLEELKLKLPELISDEKSNDLIYLLKSAQNYRYAPNPPASQLNDELEMLKNIVKEDEVS